MKQLSPRPVFDENNLEFIREEKNGYYLLMSKYHPEIRELIVNSSAFEMLKFCDGLSTVEDIVRKMKEKYPGAAEELIKRDVDRVFSSMSRLIILEWNGENPYLFRREDYLDCNYLLRVGSEEDITDIISFLDKHGTLNDTGPVSEGFVRYASPLLKAMEYQEVPLRQKLFGYVEEFFLLTKDEEITGIIGLRLPLAPLQSASISIIECPETYLNELIGYATDTLPYVSVQSTAKIAMAEEVGVSLPKSIRDVLRQRGFRDEGTSLNELGFDRDIRKWGWSYDKAYIEDVDRYRADLTM